MLTCTVPHAVTIEGVGMRTITFQVEHHMHTIIRRLAATNVALSAVLPEVLAMVVAVNITTSMKPQLTGTQDGRTTWLSV